MFSGYIRASGDDKHGVDFAWLKPCPIPSWNVAHRNAKCRSLSDHIRGHTLVYASLSSVSNLRWFSFPHILGFLHLLLLLLPMLLPSLSSLSLSVYVYAPVLMGNSGQVFCGLWGLLILNGDTFLATQLESSIITCHNAWTIHLVMSKPSMWIWSWFQ